MRGTLKMDTLPFVGTDPMKALAAWCIHKDNHNASKPQSVFEIVQLLRDAKQTIALNQRNTTNSSSSLATIVTGTTRTK